MTLRLKNPRSPTGHLGIEHRDVIEAPDRSRGGGPGFALASKAVQALVLAFYPSAQAWTHGSFVGLSALGWFSFLFMWLFQLLIFLNGMETIRKFIDFCGPVVYLVMFALAIWILWQTGNVEPVVAAQSAG
jgi:cytosine/uracil/thiamine/allantoin permease